MHYKIINGVEFIEGIYNKQGELQEEQRIIRGHRITSLDRCYKMLERTKSIHPVEILTLNSWEKYLVSKDIPFAITEFKIGNCNSYNLFVYGTEIVRGKSESKKLSKSG